MIKLPRFEGFFCEIVSYIGDLIHLCMYCTFIHTGTHVLVSNMFKVLHEF